MMRLNPLSRAGLLCIGAANLSGAQELMAAHERFVCGSGASQRLVSLFIRPADAPQAAPACRVDYTKDGETRTLWTSQSDRNYCTAKALALVTKLVEGRYACKPEAVVKQDETEASE